VDDEAPPISHYLLSRGVSPAFAEDAVQTVTPTAAVELFNGKDFTGWEFFHRDGADPKTVWKVEDGVIKCVGKPTGSSSTTSS